MIGYMSNPNVKVGGTYTGFFIFYKKEYIVYLKDYDHERVDYDHIYEIEAEPILGHFSHKSITRKLSVIKKIEKEEFNTLRTGIFVNKRGVTLIYKNGNLHCESGPAVIYPNAEINYKYFDTQQSEDKDEKEYLDWYNGHSWIYKFNGYINNKTNKNGYVTKM